MTRLQRKTLVTLAMIAIWQSWIGTCCAQRAQLRVISEVANKYEFARNAFEKGDYRAAAEAFAVLADKDPRESLDDERRMIAESRYWVAEAFMNQREFRRAQQTFRRYLADTPDGDYVEWASLRIGQTAKQLGQHDAAERSFADFLKKFPNHKLASNAYQELPGAIFAVALKDFHDFTKHGDIEGLNASKKRFEMHAHEFPDNKYYDQVRYYIGRVYLEEKEFGQAKDIFSDCLSAISSGNDDHELLPFIHFYLGEALDRLGDVATANQHFQNVVNGWPSSEAAKAAAQILAENQPAPLAAPRTQPQTEAITVSTGSEAPSVANQPPTATDLPTAELPSATGSPSTPSLAETTRNAAPNPLTVEALLATAQSQMDLRDFANAIRTLNQANQAFPSSNRTTQIQSQLGDCHFASRNMQQARFHWLRASRSNHIAPTMAASLLEKIAQSYRVEGNYHAAIREYLRLATVHENQIESQRRALNAAADCYEKIGDHRSAKRIAANRSAAARM